MQICALEEKMELVGLKVGNNIFFFPASTYGRFVGLVHAFTGVHLNIWM